LIVKVILSGVKVALLPNFFFYCNVSDHFRPHFIPV
jgi:hypothetical protein